LQHLVLLTDLHSNKPHLTACCSDRSHLAAADSGASGSIMLQLAQALSLSDQR